MTTGRKTEKNAERQARLDRREERRRRMAEVQAELMRRAKPSPLPPRPEGLRLPVWPAVAMILAFLLLFWNIPLGAVAMFLVVTYAVFTRNDPRRQLLYTWVQARRQFDRGEYAGALENFRDMEEADFSPPAVVRAIGLTQYQLGEWAEAATYLEDVPDRTPDENAALAHSLVELGELKEAVDLLQSLEELTPLAKIVWGVAELRLGRPEEARRRLEEVLAEVEGTATLEEPYLGAAYWLGKAELALGNREGAREVLSRVHEVDPDYHDVAELLRS
ncbi:MAG: tetratricopeptide repeat protein [Firmicutes bacterium]|nr:tetratricopeptide repeat protein [Bacillota bacterium]